MTTAQAGDSLTDDQRELRDRARRFVEDVLMPLEIPAELALGRLPIETIDEIKREAIAARMHGGRIDVERGGQGWSMLEWFLVNEQFGRCTNGLDWHVPNVYNVWADASPEQFERYVPAALRGEGGDAYAVTEAEAGSDPSGIATVAVPCWRRLPDHRREVVRDLGRRRARADRRSPTWSTAPIGCRRCCWSSRARTASSSSTIPPFTHSYPHGHPTIRFTDVEVGADAVIGGVGSGEQVQRRWFTEERLGIAAHGLGAMWRLLDETTEWVLHRQQGGRRIMDYQGISFPLADAATDAAVGRLLALEVCAMVDGGADPKLVHAKASMAKLFVSEAAQRCADHAVQAFGGRGYMRTNVAERYLRELRVDRIWEGTSEVQRLIIARALERRGVEATIH